MGISRIAVFLTAAGLLFAQHEFTQTDAQIGERLYIAYCIYCHGPEGDQEPGIDLGHGHFKIASSYADVPNIILHGIPDTGMPAQTRLDEQDALTIVAYLKSLASVDSDMPKGGDASRGKAIFEGKGRCLNCHSVGEEGSGLGPDLSDIGSVRRAVEMEKTLDNPDANMLPQNRIFRAVPRNGTPITGRILNQDTFTVQLIDSKERLLSLERTNLKEFVPVHSPMPSYKDRLTKAEMADLVTYLASLKGVR
jgi:putative heme-binding domain-containing protein